MNKQEPVDEVFGLHTPDELDIVKIEKYFKDLARSVTDAAIAFKYSDDEAVIDAISGIVSELTWVERDIHDLFQFYNDAQDIIASYRSLAEERMTEDELYEYNTIRVRNKMEAVK